MNCVSAVDGVKRAAISLLLFSASLQIGWSQDRFVFSLAREVQESFTTGGPFNPLVSGGSILVVKDNSSDVPVLVRFGGDGERERIPLAVPGAHRVTIYGLAGSSDTTVAATGSAYCDDGRATTFVIRMHADRKRQTVTQVWPYVPKAIALAADGTLWSIGWIRDVGGAPQYNVLKRFDIDGKELSSRIVKARGKVIRGDEASADEPRDAAVFSSLRASKDRVAWLTNSNEYIEFSLDGREIDRLDGPPNESTSGILALSDHNDVVLEAIHNRKPAFWALDRANRRWVPSVLPGADSGNVSLLLGFEGPLVVTTTPEGLVRRFKLSGTPKQSPQATCRADARVSFRTAFCKRFVKAATIPSPLGYRVGEDEQHARAIPGGFGSPAAPRGRQPKALPHGEGVPGTARL